MGFWGAVGTAAKTMQDKKQDDGTEGGAMFAGKVKEFQRQRTKKKKKKQPQKPIFTKNSV